MQIILPARQRKLLSLLNEQKKLITGVELSHKMDVSDRTIRNDILELNKLLEELPVHIRSIRGKGYVLDVEDRTLLQQLIYTEDVLLTQEDRVRYLTIRLICAEKPLRFGELEDEMFLSRTTLEKDIRLIGEKYSNRRQSLRLIRRENVISFEENEERKRLVLNELFSAEWDYQSENGVHFRDSLFDAKLFDGISDTVKQVLNGYGIKLSDIGLVHFIFAVAIAHLRISAGHCLVEDTRQVESDDQLMAAVNALCEPLEKLLDISFPMRERRYLAFLLKQKKLFEIECITRQNIDRYVEPEYRELVDAFLADIYKLYSLDLSVDDELYVGLVLHVHSLVNRLLYVYEMKSTILGTLKNRYPFAMELAMHFIPHFERMFQLKIEQNELSYIAAYMGCGVKRLVDHALEGEIVVAVASHLNYSSTQLLLTKLKSVYKQTLRLAGPFSIYEKERISSAGAALILSTVKLKDCPVKASRNIVVSPFLEGDELSVIDRQLDQIKKDQVHPRLPRDIWQYFEEELFYHNLELDDKEEILSHMSRKLLQKGYVSQEFCSDVMEREHILSSAFENGIALPRPLKSCCYKTVISAAVLQKPIQWGAGGQKVQCVFLLAIREEDRKYIMGFFDLITTLLNKTHIRKIMEAEHFEELMEVIGEAAK